MPLNGRDADGKIHITQDDTVQGKWYIKSDGLDSETHNVPSGVYDLSIIFYKQYIPDGGSQADAYNTPVYISYQTINVFDNMTTNLWMNENDDSSSATVAINKTTHAFNVSQSLVENFTNTSLYVGKPVQSNITPNDEADGGPFSPLASLGQAFNLIEAKGKGASYRIYVSGTQEGSFTVPAAITSSKASSIEITTASGNSRATLDAKLLGSALTVNSAVPLTISNLKITGGNASNGGGINIPATNTSAHVTLDTGTYITGNSAIHGDGVYVGGGSLILKGSPKVEDDDDIYLPSGKTITVGSLNGSETIAKVTEENWTRYSTIISGSGLSNSVANRFMLTAAEDDEWQKIVSSNQITIYAPIYVGSGTVNGVAVTGDDSVANSGTKTHPFETISRACQEMNDSTKNWDININGTVSGVQTVPASVNSSAASITIKGVADYNVIDAGLYSGSPTAGGSALTVLTTKPVTIQDLTIKGGNTTTNGGGINIASGASVIINSYVHIRQNKAVSGGGIYCAGTLTYSSGDIKENEATNGGGVYLDGANAKFFMSGGAFIGDDPTEVATEDNCENKATSNGGGLYIVNGAKAYLGCSGLNDQGNPVTATGYAGIQRNYAGENGGGIYNASGTLAVLECYHGRNKAAQNGGGIFINTDAVATSMSGGHFSKNEAENGGAVYISSGASFDFSGGDIGVDYTSVGYQSNYRFYNVANSCGGAVYNNGSFTISGNALLFSGSAKNNDVYLPDGKKIILGSSELSRYTSSVNSSYKINATLEHWKRGNQYLETATNITISDTVKNRVDVTDGGWVKYYNSENTYAYINSDIYIASMGTKYTCKKSGVTVTPSDDAGTSGNLLHPFKTIAAACVLLEDPDLDYTFNIDGELVGPQVIPAALKADGSGTYKAKSLMLKSASNNSVKGTLNGNSEGSALKVESDVLVTITRLSIKGGSAEKGGGLYVDDGAKVQAAYDTVIKGNTASANGGGVYVAAGGTAYFYSSGIIIGNSEANAESIGETDLTKGVNTAVNGAAIYNAGTCKFGIYIYNGSETSNSSTNINVNGNTASGSGGSIYNTGTFVLGYGTCYMRYNKAVQDGGGFYNDGSVDSASLSISIENNKADRNGGGIYVAAGKEIYLPANANIKSNTAVNNGGGFYNAGTLKLITSINCYSNNAKNGGGVFNAGTCNFTTGSIGAADAYNTAGSEGKGGAVYICSGSTFSMKDSARIPYGNAVNTNDVYLEKTTNNGTTAYATINITGNLSTTTVAAITASEWKRGVPVLTKGSTTAINDTIAAKFSFTDGGWNNTVYNSGNNSKIDAPIYVAGSDKTKCTGDPIDSGNTSGNVAHPFASIAGALSLIKDKNVDYTIEIDGTIKGSQELPATLTDGSDGDTDYMAKSLLLKGTNGLDSSTQIPKDSINTSANGKGRVLAVYAKKVPVTIQNLLLTGAEIDGSGGGIYINGSDTSLILSDGAVVNGNTAVSGGGVYLYSGNLFLNGTAVVGKPGTVSSCAGTTSGTYANKATFTGGGIAIEQGTLWLGYRPPQQTETQPQTIATTGGVIYNLVTSSSGECHGGGIDNSQGTVHFAKGNVKYNYAHGPQSGDTDVGCGGGISTAYTFNLSGDAVISDNKAADGGGVYITTNTGNLVMTGGTISSNVAERTGGAVYNMGTFSIGGTSVSISPGSAQTNDIYIAENKPLTVTDTLPTGAQIAITPWSFVRGNKLIKTSSTYADELAKFKVTDANNDWRLYKPFVDGTNRWARLDADLWVASAGTSTGRASTVNAPPASGRNGTKAKPYATIAEALAQVWDDGTSKTVDFVVNISGSLNGEQSIANTVTNAKSIKLLGDANADKTEIDGNNGERTRALLTINTAVPVTITNLTIKNGYNSSGSGGGISVSAAGASLTLSTGAVVSGNTTSGNGGGIYIAGTNAAGGTANLIMNSTATVSANSAGDYNGGGVYLEYANLCMSGSALIGDTGVTGITNTGGNSSNSAARGGGVYCSTGSNIYLGCNTSGETSSGGVSYELSSSYGIRHNYGKYTGGGVDLRGSMTIKSGAVSYNATHFDWANSNGGGIWQNSGTTITMSGGTIAKNKANFGGGVYAGGSFTMTGGTIGDSSNSIDSPADSGDNTHSNSASYGGGIYAPSGASVTLSGGYINYNYSTNSGGGIYWIGSTLSVTDGNISYNHGSYGGAVYFNSGATLTKATFTKNNASSGGALYIYSGQEVTVSGAAAFTGNTASSGGAIYNDGTFNLTGGATFTSNSASTSGGAVYNDGAFTMSAGTIGGSSGQNTAGSYGDGGAVWCDSDSTFTMSGSASIPYGGSVKSNDIFLNYGSSIGLGNTLSNHSPSSQVGVTLSSGFSTGNAVLTGTSTNIQNHYQKFKLTADTDKHIDEDGYLRLNEVTLSSITTKNDISQKKDDFDHNGASLGDPIELETILGKIIYFRLYSNANYGDLTEDKDYGAIRFYDLNTTEKTIKYEFKRFNGKTGTQTVNVPNGSIDFDDWDEFPSCSLDIGLNDTWNSSDIAIQCNGDSTGGELFISLSNGKYYFDISLDGPNDDYEQSSGYYWE